ncbi:MAG TPA: hypothetical protein VEB59_02150, partial [Gemmatimonadales bacterium]|nr:hypothetical protein [Gemmatimonadales bacterium]
KKPTIRTIDVDTTTVVDVATGEAAAVLRIRYTITATGGPDSLFAAITATGQANVTRKYAGNSAKDSLDIPRPAQGATITVSLTPTAKKLGKTAAGDPISKTYTEPVVVEKPTATLELIPAGFTLAPGAPDVMCVVAVATDGTRRLAPASDSLAICRQRFAAT